RDLGFDLADHGLGLLGAQAQPDHAGGQYEHATYQDYPIHEAKVAVPQQLQGDQPDGQQVVEHATRDLRVHLQGGNDLGETEDEGDVGDVGTQGIAHGETGIALQGGDDGYEDLRRRGAEADDGQADDQR